MSPARRLELELNPPLKALVLGLQRLTKRAKRAVSNL
jgi:hypothetical protein